MSSTLRDPYREALSSPEIVTELRGVNIRLDEVNGRLDRLDERLESMDAKLASIDAKLDAGFETMIDLLAKILAKL